MAESTARMPANVVCVRHERSLVARSVRPFEAALQRLVSRLVKARYQAIRALLDDAPTDPEAQGVERSLGLDQGSDRGWTKSRVWNEDGDPPGSSCSTTYAGLGSERCTRSERVTPKAVPQANPQPLSGLLAGQHRLRRSLAELFTFWPQCVTESGSGRIHDGSRDCQGMLLRQFLETWQCLTRSQKLTVHIIREVVRHQGRVVRRVAFSICEFGSIVGRFGRWNRRPAGWEWRSTDTGVPGHADWARWWYWSPLEEWGLSRPRKTSSVKRTAFTYSRTTSVALMWPYGLSLWHDWEITVHLHLVWMSPERYPLTCFAVPYGRRRATLPRQPSPEPVTAHSELERFAAFRAFWTASRCRRRSAASLRDEQRQDRNNCGWKGEVELMRFKSGVR